MSGKRTKAERAADEASETVRRMQREEVSPAQLRVAVRRREKAWRLVARLREGTQ